MTDGQVIGALLIVAIALGCLAEALLQRIGR